MAGLAIARGCAVQKSVIAMAYTERMTDVDRVYWGWPEIASVCSCRSQEIVGIEQFGAVDMMRTESEVAAVGTE